MYCCYSFEVGSNTSLWWSISDGALVSDSCGQSNALVIGTDLVDRVATTKPLAISAAPTASVLLHEGFDVSSDITRLVSEGYVTFVLISLSYCTHI